MKKIFKPALALLMAVSLMFALASCTTSASTGVSPSAIAASSTATAASPSTQSPGTIKIGVVIPLTGDAAWAGEAVKKVCEYSVEEINAKGGIDNKKVEFIYEDDAATSSKSVTAVQKLINIDKVNAIVGPMFTTCLLAVKDIVNEEEVVLIQGTSANPEIFKENGYIFSLDTATETTIKTTTRYLIGEKGFKTIAIFGKYDDQTLSMIDYFKKHWPENGGTIAYCNTYNPSNSDFRTELTQIKALKPDIVWFNGSESNGSAIMRQMYELGFNESTWICSDYETVGDSFLTDFGKYIDGHFNYLQTGIPGDAVTQAAYDALTKSFTAWGGEVTPVTHLMYDCLQTLFTAMKGGSYSGADLRKSLAATNNLAGTTGYTTFESNGNSNRSNVVVEYKNGAKVYKMYNTK